MSEFYDPRNKGAYGHDEVLSYKQIIMEYIKLILQLGAVEFRGGYYNEKVVSVNGQSTIAKEYVQDSREAYTGAINNLHHAMKIYRDPEYNKQIKLYQEELEAMMKKLHEDVESGQITEDKALDAIARHYGYKFELLLELLVRNRFLADKRGVTDGI